MRTMAGNFVAMATLMLMSATGIETAEAGHGRTWSCERDRLTSFWEADIAGRELKGGGFVCATDRGLWSQMQVRGLTPGNAYTVWWVYIDDPASCAGVRLTPENSPVPFPEPAGYAGACGLADFFTPDASGESLDPLAVLGRMDSVVAGRGGKTWFWGDLRGMTPAQGSQVWMFIFGHGPADTGDKRQLARQLLTPEDPGVGSPHLGIEGRPFGYPAGVVVVDID